MTCERQIISGEMHYARIPHEYWRARLRMAAALGVNTISTYVFWNRHERTPEEYDFQGDNDIRAFIGFAKDEGLDVILRPGPYVCAEWDFGGLPAWLLRDDNVRVRTTDQRFMTPVRRWFERLGQELAPLQRLHGGPIIAVQLENEYGAFGSDPEYLHEVRTALDAAGLTQSPLFTIDQPNDLAAGSLPDIPIATTFAPGDPAANLARIRELRPSAPLLCGEYWAGWYDHWGEPHAQLDDAQQIVDLEWMLAQGVSVNVYMLHGGTNFGFWNGANASDRDPFQPASTSYDYCAAIDESGRPAPKYHGFRAAIERVTGRTLPPVPENSQCTSIAEFVLSESAALGDLLEAPVRAEQPLTMEQLDQPFGFVLYRTILNVPSKGVLCIEGLRDYATVLIDDRIVAKFDRRTGENAVPVEAAARATLDILVENCGRINYGPQFAADRKGITGHVTLDGEELTQWEMHRLPMERLDALRFGKMSATAPCFYRGAFNIETPEDTFFDVSDLGKGVLWVNGRNLGRFWNIGPQRTLYVPAPWLRGGRNEVVAFDVVERNSRPRLCGVTAPLFDR
jgi:beta-galactosidase